MIEKKSPQRMCIACREMKEKRELLRIVKNADGAIFIDNTGKQNGRGAYICNSIDCMKKCAKGRMLNRTFKCEVPLTVYEEVLAQISKEKTCH